MAYLIFYIYHFLSFFFFRNMDSVWHNLNQTVYLSYISSIYRLRFSVNFETKSVLFLESRWAKAAPCYHAFRPHCLLFNTRRIPSLNSKRGGAFPFSRKHGNIRHNLSRISSKPAPCHVYLFHLSIVCYAEDSL